MTALNQVPRTRANRVPRPLTELPNRRFGESFLASRVDEQLRNGRPYGVLVLDIDFFKKVNDRLGHQAGDEVLKMVAHSISGGIRDGDLACRWGGEEFLVALANPAPGQLSHIATRRCSLVRSSSIATVEGPLRVTVSIGATLSEPGMPPDRVIARADELLYESKHAGRDRVTCDTEPAPAEELAEAS